MKVQCDVCGRDEASVFCCADEAALCAGCDRRVHRANKVAEKHRRFSLHGPSSDPLCDVCQEKRGFVFCQEDRAILCRDCDDSIHNANDLTRKHSRFLLVGARLSEAPILASDSRSSSPEVVEIASNTKKKRDKEAKVDQDKILDAGSSVLCSTTTATTTSASSNGSSISDYLIKVCPGWQIEDLLVDDFSKVQGNEQLPFLDRGELEQQAAEIPTWAPQVPQLPSQPDLSTFSGRGGGAGQLLPAWVGPKEVIQSHGFGAKVGRETWRDDALTVPQITPASNPSKRARPSFSYYY
ncbi:B-box zinc finger protein 20-like [Typha latifolia]|uniref:B-box zinc finger protein 20-like n=1 Tax=Typha latifolia TaxID=4733 RepID=UPI003C2BAD4F